MRHLRFDCITAQIKYDEHRHPQEVMKDLGITYQHATPQTVGDQWWFWNCQNIPDNLPGHIIDLDINDPMEYVGFGLSEEKAREIRDFGKDKVICDKARTICHQTKKDAEKKIQKAIERVSDDVLKRTGLQINDIDISFHNDAKYRSTLTTHGDQRRKYTVGKVKVSVA